MAVPFCRNQLLKLWGRLTLRQRARLLARVYHYKIINLMSLIPHLKSPIRFAVRSTFAMFSLLMILPDRIMVIPIAIGGGLAFALITH